MSRNLAYRDNYTIFISGRLQKEGDADQGVPGMATDFEERFQETGLARVELRKWDADWDDLAEWIFRRCSHRRNVRILVIPYSWGGGYGFRELAKSCRRRGIRISGFVASDSVAHFGPAFCHRLSGLYSAQIAACWPPPWPEFLRTLPRLKIKLPDNINRTNCHWFVQENSWLRGHDMVWQDTGEPVPNRIVIPGIDHNYMDECVEFRERALLSAYEMFGVPLAT